MIKKVFTLFLLVIFMLLGLSACLSPWAIEIMEMKTTWKSETPFIQFTIPASEPNGIGFGYVVDSNGEKKDICFLWSGPTSHFFIYLTNGETDYNKICAADDVVLYGMYSYHSKRNKQVKLTIKEEDYPDSLFNGLYDSIILTYL
ncbi:MAG: hypothetical protein LBE09_07420 [Christensenellaceae bacterium]|nr:hypothetical protein [Christensenellaceae bacterium]